MLTGYIGVQDISAIEIARTKQSLNTRLQFAP